MTSKVEHIIVIGGGQAGGTACVSLRQFGYEGLITLVGGENTPPYQRPPLSKAYLKGEMAKERLYIKPANFYSENNIQLKLGCNATTIDRSAKRVEFDDGTALTYDKLIIATGSRPRTLDVEGADLNGVLNLRTLDDVDRLKPFVTPDKRLVIVGAGYIGLEAAAVGRELGVDVTVLEATERVLCRVTSPVLSEFYQDQHKRHGVEIRLNARMKQFCGANGALTGVELDDGEIIPADVALVGIGILPNQEIAAKAGIKCADGVLSDEDAQTSDPDIFAIGDCARRPISQYQRDGRLESVHNAVEQGRIAAARILGKPRPKIDAPWFWSDQYDLKLQTAGLLTGFDEVIIRGDMNACKFAAYYLKDGVFLAVDAVNAPQDFLFSKKLVGANARPDTKKLSDTNEKIKDIVNEALA